MNEGTLISVCGLDCSVCPLYNIPTNKKVAENMISWFKKEKWLKEDEGLKEVLEKGMYCKSCHGDRSIHWSPDCWILKCCVDDKKLNRCSECNDFPCDRLVDWSKKDKKYGQALERLKSMKK